MALATLRCDRTSPSGLKVCLEGDWLLAADLPNMDEALAGLSQSPRPAMLEFDAQRLGDWDTGLLTRVVAILRCAEANGVPVEAGGLPEGARRIVDLSLAVREREGAARSAKRAPLRVRLGESVLEAGVSLREMITFFGELVLAFGRLVRGRARYQKADLALAIQEAGAEAFPIVSLITFLIGMIFAFVGVMQLNKFGVGIYTADLVAVAMIREMSPIMTGIIMAGRTGAAYAAELGTMKVNEEIDALTTLGINPMDFLVVPRVLALVFMLPLLSIYGSLLGILGGLVVGMSMLDVSLIQYLEQTKGAVTLNSVLGGLFKALVYGSLVAVAGCREGMACGGSAMAVGQSTTKAVVMGIVLIIVSASILTVIYINLGI